MTSTTLKPSLFSMPADTLARAVAPRPALRPRPLGERRSFAWGRLNGRTSEVHLFEPAPAPMVGPWRMTAVIEGRVVR